MTDPQQVIDESRRMLEEFLSNIGLQRAGTPLDLPGLLEPFSRWVDEQEVKEADRFYLAPRRAAFIREYLIEVHSGQRVIEGRRERKRGRESNNTNDSIVIFDSRPFLQSEHTQPR
jgi:hypothetical protein